MVKEIPEKVKGCLSELTAAQQVILRGYIGTLRAEIKDLEEQIRTINDPDPHAHYHGKGFFFCLCFYTLFTHTHTHTHTLHVVIFFFTVFTHNN